MKVSIITAHSSNYVIGKDGGIPWYIPEDFKDFKEKTMGAPLVMGKKTFQSLPGVLPGRPHVILTRGGNFPLGKGGERCHIAGEFRQALRMAKSLAKLANRDEIFIIGGEEVYKQALPIADNLYVTYVRREFEGDTFFPQYKDQYTLADYREGQFLAEDGLDYTFTKWVRNVS